MALRWAILVVALGCVAALRVSSPTIRAPTASRAACPLVMRGGESAEAVEDVPTLAQHPQRKVALLVEPTPFTHVSGYCNRFKEMLRYLQEGGDDVKVVTTDDTVDKPGDFLGMPITYVPGFRLILYKQVQLTVDWGLQGLKMLRSFQPDLIHAATPGFFVLPAIVYSRLLGKPLVISYHTHLPIYADRYMPVPGLKQLGVWFAESILPLILNWGDLTLVTSPQLQQQLEDLGCRRVDVWRKGIDTNVFSPAFNASNDEMRSALTDGEPHRPLLLYVGRVGTEKNIPLIREVLDRIPEARLAVVGQGPAEADLKQLFKGTDTKFMGLMQGEALSRAYAAADVFVMPSESETLGFVVLESMASGVPTVCANAGGVPNLVKDGETGFLFAPGDADDMARRVRELISDAPLRAKMGAAGRKETEQWDWKAATSVLRNVQYAQAEKNFAGRGARGPLSSAASFLKKLVGQASDAAGAALNPNYNTTMA